MSKVGKGVVFLDRGNYTTCTVHLFGGTILSYRVKNNEILYMKRKTKFDNNSPIRGGIKYTFPYFGQSLRGPNHGCSRYLHWNLESGPTTLPDRNIEAVFSTSRSAYSQAVWDYKFKLSVKLTLCVDRLILAVKVENPSHHFPFSFTIMRHMILKVEDIAKVEIRGLSKCQYYKWHYLKSKRIIQDPDPDEDKLVFRGEKEDIYINTPPVLEINNIDSRGLKLRITQCDKASTDVLVHNLSEESDPQIEDDSHIHGEWKTFLGLGHGQVTSSIRLKPGEIWQSQQIIEVIDEEYDRKIERYVRLINDPWELLKEQCDPVNQSLF